MCRIKFRKIAYFSDEAIRLMKEGDEEIIELYRQVYFHNLSFLDVYLLTDNHFKKLSKEQEALFSQMRENTSCKEITL